jgi:hypothetical protein
MHYAVIVTTSGQALTADQASELGRLGATVSTDGDTRRCAAAFTIDATDAPSAAALAIEGVRAVRGDVTVEHVEVSAAGL